MNRPIGVEQLLILEATKKYYMQKWISIKKMPKRQKKYVQDGD